MPEQLPPLIFHIDDSPTTRKIVQVTMEREGYRVMGFADGILALQWLVSPQAEMPSLIFLDITLPKCDGYQIARHLKGKPAFAAVPILMLTRHNGVIDHLRARLSGASDLIPKPFTTQTLLQLTCHYLARTAHPAAEAGTAGGYYREAVRP